MNVRLTEMEQPMNLQQMKYVIYIAQYHSISKAARKLFVTQPNLSNAVKELEKELGIQIFERKKNGVSLTKEGTEFVNGIQPIVQQVGMLEQHYKNKSDGEIKYSLNVACQHSNFAGEALCRLLEGLGESPYKVQLLEVKTKEILEYLDHGLCDIGILLRNQNNKVLEWELEKRKLEFHLLAQLTPHVFVQDNHPLAEKTLITEEDLRPYPYIKYDQGIDSNRFFSEDLIENNTAEKIITVNDKMTDMNFSRQLNGYTLGSGLRVGRFASQSGRSIPYQSDEMIELGWIISREKKQSALCKNFINILEDMTKKNKI